jgi:hypothetical protein
MNDPADFGRLATAVERIARHPDFPGKPQAVSLCLEDIERISREGRITTEQASVLCGILLSPCEPFTSNAA